jgi:hypothetical protein
MNSSKGDVDIELDMNNLNCVIFMKDTGGVDDINSMYLSNSFEHPIGCDIIVKVGVRTDIDVICNRDDRP